jgi:predicted transcriptional regulator
MQSKSRYTNVTICQAYSFAAIAAQSACTPGDEVIAKFSERLQLTQVGEDFYSAEAIEHLIEGIRQADHGELVSQEEVEAFFSDWEKEVASR